MRDHFDEYREKVRRKAKKRKARFYYRETAGRLVIAVSHESGEWRCWEAEVKRRSDGVEE